MGTDGEPDTWPETKARSIFRMSTGRLARVLSEENPVPKSSMARRTPSCFKVVSLATPPSTSEASAVSVTSSTTLSDWTAGSDRIFWMAARLRGFGSW